MDWQPFLKRWSEEWIVAHRPERDWPLDDDVIRDGWLGFTPASEDEIAAAEARLGRPLPPSLRGFLLVTNGWRDAGNFIYHLAGTEDLDWIRDTKDANWADAYAWAYEDDRDNEPRENVIARSLRISLAGDAAVLFLDPYDVDEHGEWAGYWLSSWSGQGPERHGSFAELMCRLYASFHALRKPPGETRDHWDARVEQARLAALAGDVDGPLSTLATADEYGRDRAKLLRFQLQAMLGNWYGVSLPQVVIYGDRPALARDPLFAAELLPLLFAEDRLSHTRERFTLMHLARTNSEPYQPLIADYQARLAQPDFRLSYGNPEFDTAVRRIVDRLTAHPAFQVRDVADDPAAPFVTIAYVGSHPRPEPGPTRRQIQEARQRLIDEAWPELLAAMRFWRPVSENHIAPVVLFADPVLAKMITPERGREILAMPRGHHEHFAAR